MFVTLALRNDITLGRLHDNDLNRVEDGRFVSFGSGNDLTLGRLHGNVLNRVEDGRFVSLGSGNYLTLGRLHGDGAFAFAVHVQQLSQVESGTF